MIQKLVLRPLTIIILLSLLFNIITWAVAIFVFPQSGPAAILHYTVPLGVDFIGESRQIYILPLIGLVIIVGNTALGWLIHRPSLRAAWVLWAVLPGIQVILFAATVLLWQFNQ